MGFLKYHSTSAHDLPSPLQMWVIVALSACPWPSLPPWSFKNTKIIAEDGDKSDHINSVVALNAETNHCREENKKFTETQSILFCAFIAHILLHGVGRWTECQKQDENFSAEHGDQKFTWLLSVKQGFKRSRQQQSDTYRAPGIPFPIENIHLSEKWLHRTSYRPLDLKGQPDIIIWLWLTATGRFIWDLTLWCLP